MTVVDHLTEAREAALDHATRTRLLEYLLEHGGAPLNLITQKLVRDRARRDRIINLLVEEGIVHIEYRLGQSASTWVVLNR